MIIADNFGITHRALRWKAISGRLSRSLLKHNRDNLGDHIPGPPYDYGVANPNIQSFYLIPIMQSRIGNCCSSHKYGFQSSNGSYGSRSPHLNINAQYPGQLFLGRKFVGQSPTWATR